MIHRIRLIARTANKTKITVRTKDNVTLEQAREFYKDNAAKMLNRDGIESVEWTLWTAYPDTPWQGVFTPQVIAECAMKRGTLTR